jgi:hypothetical protein
MSPLNSYFLNGSPSEQRLLQDLVNEQLRMFGQDVVYMPRKFVNKKTIIKEEIVSQFNDSFRLEAYITNVQGFGGQGDILSKFGVRTTDETTFIISKERYEDFISPFLVNQPDTITSIRPEEGDLIYFPLDNSLFEIKYVEGKKPFYQLNNLYVYELRCEIFEYEDEIIDTTIAEVDESVKDFGHIITIKMVNNETSSQAYAQVGLATEQGSYFGKSIRYIDLICDGTGYLSTPTITLSPPPKDGIEATAVAIMTSRIGRKGSSINKILLINPGIGYTEIPNVIIKSSSGSGGIATAVLGDGSLGPIQILSGGAGYSTAPFVYVGAAPPGWSTAIVEPILSATGIVTALLYSNSGIGYTRSPIITITPPVGVSTGNYLFNEIIKGTSSETTARVKEWDYDTKTLKVSIANGSFTLGETIVGMGTTAGGSNATYKVFSIEYDNIYDNYSENKEIEDEFEQIFDFSEQNPFADF